MVYKEKLNDTIEKDDVYKRDNCRLCASTDLELVFPLPSIPLADNYYPESRKHEGQKCYPMEVNLCKGCGLVFLRHVVDPEIIYRDYVYKTISSPGLVEHFAKYANDILERIKPAKGSLVVELGSNDGILLRNFKNAGLKVLGIDPARETARQATEAGIETWPEFFNPEISEKIKNDKGKASIVIANNVFANIDHVDPIAEGVRNILAPDGVFIFETACLVDTINNLVFDFIYHEHVSYFSVKPLETFFKKHGMEIIRVDRAYTKGGSIRCTVQLKGGPRKVEASVRDLINMEVAEGFYKRERYDRLSKTLKAEKEKLLKLLKEYKAQGKTIAGYGASHTVTTFIYYFDVAEFLDFIVDDNPLKHNTFSPGFHIPVLDSQALYEKKPDVVVILAWRFTDLIVKKHEKFLTQGGHFIAPIPEVKVI